MKRARRSAPVLLLLSAGMIAGANVGTASAQVPGPPRIYEGEIQTISSVCGGGTITLETDAGMTYVSAISTEGFNVSGDGVTSVPLYLNSRFDPETVPIDEGGDFEGAYFRNPQEPSLEATVEGTVSDVQFHGVVSFSPSVCGEVPYSGRLVGSPTPAFALPSVGSGRQERAGIPWPVLALSGGVALTVLALGSAAIRRGAQSRSR